MARGHFWRWTKRAAILTLGILAAAYAADYVSSGRAVVITANKPYVY
jgi:hypothetical protein